MLLLALSTVADAQQRSGRGRFRSGFGDRTRDSLQLAAMSEIQRELNVRPEQEKLLEALFADISEQRREFFSRARGQRGRGPNE